MFDKMLNESYLVNKHQKPPHQASTPKATTCGLTVLNGAIQGHPAMDVLGQVPRSLRVFRKVSLGLQGYPSSSIKRSKNSLNP